MSEKVAVELPFQAQETLQELLKTGKPVVLVLFTGRPLVLVEENQTVPAILNTWFVGRQELQLLMFCLEM
jgi:beta-glucosidase